MQQICTRGGERNRLTDRDRDRKTRQTDGHTDQIDRQTRQTYTQTD